MFKGICPPPTHIETIKVKKVFEECRNAQIEAIAITGFIPGSSFNATEARCLGATILDSSCTINPDTGTVTVSYLLEVGTEITRNDGSADQQFRTVSVSKTFKLSRAGEEGLEAQCHIYPECLKCFISERDPIGNVLEVTCCVGVLILVKLDSEVQLLIPSYGYTSEPPECEDAVDECPNTYDPQWPPYPSDDNLCNCP